MAAEAMPAEKFDFAPPASAGDFKGVRTFGAQVKHVTESQTTTSLVVAACLKRP